MYKTLNKSFIQINLNKIQFYKIHIMKHKKKKKSKIKFTGSHTAGP